jgi:fumarate hydratase class II
MQVFGCDGTVTAAAASGNFELNVALPVIAYNLLLSTTILANACEVLANKCVAGIVANRAHMERLAAQNAILATALTPYIGYDKAAEVVKKAMAENKTIREVVLEMGLMDAEQLDKVLDIRRMTEGGFVAGVSAGG